MSRRRFTTLHPEPGRRATGERLGAHVSVRGGLEHAPDRGRAIGATAIQVFTKNPNQWREPELDDATCRAFRQAVKRCDLNGLVAHDSYLINLASPDGALRKRSEASFAAELQRCKRLGIPYLVSHPGNYIDDHDAGLARNAEACTRVLEAVPDGVSLLLETTAGSGTALGRTFEELAALIAAMPGPVQRRVGVCLDTCHVWAAGYDLVDDYDGVWQAFDDHVGLDRLRCLHLNDSVGTRGSRRDRHALIGEGTLGPGPFQRVMRDERFVSVIKILETPKGPDEVTNDRASLALLRRMARVQPRGHR